MKYTDLTLTQRIALKGLIRNDPLYRRYNDVWLKSNFKKALQEFLTFITTPHYDINY